MTVWYWEEFDELLLVDNRVHHGDTLNPDEIDSIYYPRMSLSHCVYIGEFE